jgi:uncharacterized protein (TIGR03546 family)
VFIAKLIKEILKILQTDISPNQIAFGAAVGVFLGLVPGIAMKCVFFFLILLLRVNIGSALAACTLFGVLGLALDPAADKIGFFILNADSLVPFWTYLYNAEIIPLTNFNNSLVAGNIVLGIIFFAPVFFASKKFISYYRTHWRDKVIKWRVTKLLTAGILSHTILK